MFTPGGETSIMAIVICFAIIGVFLALRRTDIATHGRTLIYLGLLLLAAGDITYIIRDLAPEAEAYFTNNKILGIIQKNILLHGGLLTIGFGLIRVLPDIASMERTKRLLAHGAHGDSDSLEIRALLDSVLRSGLGGTVCLRALRNAAGEVEDYEIKLMNPAAEQVLGRASTTLVGRRMLVDFPCLHNHPVLDDAFSVLESGLPHVVEHKFATPTGEIWHQIALVKHGDGLTVTFSDVTTRRTVEQQLRYAAEHDTLTGLVNRAGLHTRIDQAISRSSHEDAYAYAVLFLDFDRFKIINDSLGHETGDQLLMSIADRLRETIRAISDLESETSRHVLARLGGDEFVIMLDDIGDDQNAAIVADNLVRTLAEPHRINGHVIVSTASIGIVTSHGQYRHAEEIIRDADTAMYEAKRAGKGRHVSFDQSMRRMVVSKLAIETRLRTAIEHGMFFLEYQPMVDLESGRIVGAEALVRLTDPERGVVPPDEFMHVAEELNLIGEIGRIVLERACSSLAMWKQRVRDMDDLFVTINLTKTEFNDPELATRVIDTLDRYDLQPSAVRLEITESTIISCFDQIEPTVAKLRDLGVMTVIDDFGTGHSSLACISTLPFDGLKIDRTFVNGQKKLRAQAAILDSIVALSHNLNLWVIGEGVETADQLAMLQAVNCDIGQGWLFGESVSAEQFEQKLLQDRVGRAAEGVDAVAA